MGPADTDIDIFSQPIFLPIPIPIYVKQYIGNRYGYRYFHICRYLADICRYIGRYPCIITDILPIPIYPISRLADPDTDMADTDIQFADTHISVSVSATYIGKPIHRSNPNPPVLLELFLVLDVLPRLHNELRHIPLIGHLLISW